MWVFTYVYKCLLTILLGKAAEPAVLTEITVLQLKILYCVHLMQHGD